MERLGQLTPLAGEEAELGQDELGLEQGISAFAQVAKLV
jgi:hypothetical protein